MENAYLAIIIILIIVVMFQCVNKLSKPSDEEEVMIRTHDGELLQEPKYNVKSAISDLRTRLNYCEMTHKNIQFLIELNKKLEAHIQKQNQKIAQMNTQNPILVVKDGMETFSNKRSDIDLTERMEVDGDAKKLPELTKNLDKLGYEKYADVINKQYNQYYYEPNGIYGDGPSENEVEKLKTNLDTITKYDLFEDLPAEVFLASIHLNGLKVLSVDQLNNQNVPWVKYKTNPYVDSDENLWVDEYLQIDGAEQERLFALSSDMPPSYYKTPMLFSVNNRENQQKLAKWSNYNSFPYFISGINIHM